MCIQIDEYCTERNRAIIRCPVALEQSIIRAIESVGSISIVGRIEKDQCVKIAVDVSGLEMAWHLSQHLHGDYVENGRGGYMIRLTRAF